ncbi:hypothetical protein [Candidatus Frankia alpina]|uniref:hypothetical protein n=1 Tax=Candidatus Frankia alpina TaxID=2699483 RepID=UPI0013D314B1|nr:hypothetical protein [Candidatus Frankia alpina]
MVDDDPTVRHADELAAAADELLERLDHETPPAPRGVDRLDAGRLGRWIAVTAGGTVLAILGSALAVVLVVLQWSTRTEAAEAAAQRAVTGVIAAQHASEESNCRILALGRRKPGEPPPTTALGLARAQQYEAEYRRRGCPQ